MDSEMTHMTGNGDAVKRHRLFQIMKEMLRAERKGKDLMDAFRNLEPKRGGLARFMISILCCPASGLPCAYTDMTGHSITI